MCSHAWMQAHALRVRLLGAIAAAGLLEPACRGSDPEVVAVPPTVSAVPPPVSAVPPLASAPTSPAFAPSPPAPSAAPPPPPAPASVEPPSKASVPPAQTARATACKEGTKPEKYCYVARKGPPRQIPNATFEFDARGCVADSEVVNNCEGVRAVLSGPTVEGQNCCHRVCRGPIPPCGRPLLAADGSARVAASAPGRGWMGELPEAPLSDPLRDAWLADAAAEHASVAAFARFSLELLAVGAPASLVAEAQRAGLDEIEHARACFALAAAYGGEERGPAPLSLDGIVLRSDLAAIAAAATEEGCVGEAFAACALAEARDGCELPSVRETLARIADDEARHAELGFRFVAWAIARGGAAVRAAVEAAFARALAAPPPMPSTPDDPAWRAAGRLTEGDHHAAWTRAVREVIAPCRDALLARS